MPDFLPINGQKPIAGLEGIIRNVVSERAKGGAHRRHDAEAQMSRQRHILRIGINCVCNLP